MSRTSSIASGILAAPLPSTQIADAVYTQAELQRPTKIATTMTPSAVLRAAKSDGWVSAVSLAASSSDTAVLAKLSRDSRRQVRRAVAENPACDEDTLRYLFTWATKNSDEETLVTTTTRCDLAWLNEREQIANADRAKKFPWHTLAQRLVTDETMLHLGVEHGNFELDRALCRFLGNGPIYGVSLTQLCERWRTSALLRRISASMVAAAWTANASVNAEMAQVAVAEGSNVFPHNLLRLDGPTPEGGRPFSSEALDVLIDGPEIWHWNVAAEYGKLTREQVARLLAKKDAHQVYRNLRDHIPVMSTEQLEELTVMSAKDKDPLPGELLLDPDNDFAPREPLSARTVFLALQEGNAELTTKWVAGRLLAKPLPGEIQELLASPKRALNSQYGYGYSSMYRTGLEELTADKIALRFSPYFHETATQPWAAELVEALGVGFFALAERNTAASVYVAAQFTVSFGDNLKAWEMAFGLLENHNGSLGQLIGTVRRLMAAHGTPLDA